MVVRLFKYMHYEYYALMTPNRPNQWGLWACSVFDETCIFLAYCKDGTVEESSEVFEGYKTEWAIRKGAERAIAESPPKVRRAIDKMFGYDNIDGMTKRNIPERDQEIFKKKYHEKWNFRQIAAYFNMSVSSVWAAYKRVKDRSFV